MQTEFDLRASLDVLIQNWRLVIAVPVLVTLIVLAVDVFIRAPQYLVTAQAFIKTDASKVEFDERFTTVDNRPQLGQSALVAVALNEALLQELYQTYREDLLDVANFLAFQDLFEVETDDNQTLVSLRVTYADAKIAAEMANDWLALYLVAANRLYSERGDHEVQYLAEQQAIAQANLAELDATIIAFQAQNRFTVVDQDLTAMRTLRERYLDRQVDIRVTQERARGLLTQLEAVSITDSFFSQELATIALLVQTFGRANPTFEVSGELSVPTTSAQQMTQVESLLTTLDEAYLALDADIEALEPELLALQAERQQLAIAGDRILVEHALAKDTFEIVSNKLAEARVVAGENNARGVVAVGEAVVPDKEIAPRESLDAALAFAVGLVMTVIFCLGRAWWQAPRPL